MILDDLIQSPGAWLEGSGPDAEIVLSSRIRLARNLEKVPFPHWASPEQAEQVLHSVETALRQSDGLPGALFLRLKDFDAVDRQFLVERHLISVEHSESETHRGVAIGPRESVSVMVNEEDHMRIQVLISGFNLDEAWKVIVDLDERLQRSLPVAYSGSWGYLTACPTNVGTGLRASVLIHLPCLVLTKQIGRVVQALAKLNIVTRGLYGEGTEATGNLFQLSNQVTLGQSEEDILDNIGRVIRQIIAHEREARRVLMSQSQMALSDRVGRAFGTLKSAQIITSSETINLLSAVRLGVDLGLIKQLSRQDVNALFIMTQPAHLQKIEKKSLTAQERDIKRADLIRNRLAGKLS